MARLTRTLRPAEAERRELSGVARVAELARLLPAAARDTVTATTLPALRAEVAALAAAVAYLLREDARRNPRRP